MIPTLEPPIGPERRFPLRFVWQLDADEKFTIAFSEFVDLAGPRTAAVLGRRWSAIASKLALDPEGEFARAVASRDTWSGIAMAWPLDGVSDRLMVELSGLPVFDRNRTFQGYRGFGVCRDVDRLAAARAVHAAAAGGAPHSSAPEPDRLERRPVLTVVPSVENVLPFRGTARDEKRAVLTPLERQAFREIARALGASAEGDNALPEPTESPAANESAPPAIKQPPQPDDTAVAHQQSEPTMRALDAEIRELSSILDTATDGVVVMDREGRILSSNRSAQALFAYEAPELAGRHFLDLFAPESHRAVLDYLEGLTRTGVASLLNDGREVVGRVRQGGLIPLFMTMGPVGDGGEKFCAVFRDIAQWKRAEEELTGAKRHAERASSAKSDFLAKISHEIRTPLNAIIGFSEVMMEERFGPVANDRYRQYLRDIHAGGQHLVSLINDLLDLSKIEAGKLDLSFASVDINELTQQCVALMQPQANRERIIIRASLSPRLPPVVADARSIRQIVLNLLSNSIKFTAAGGQVIVSTALAESGEAVLRVRDTGIGMSSKDIETALEPFRQVSNSARWSTEGTGLGLPLTKALAEANGAVFQIRSAVNSGTLVEIIFPAARMLAE